MSQRPSAASGIFSPVGGKPGSPVRHAARAGRRRQALIVTGQAFPCPFSRRRESDMTRMSTAARTRLFPQGRETSVRRRNVGDLDRWASLLGVGDLTAYGLARGGPGGVVLALPGGGLLYHGASSHSKLYEALGVRTAGRHTPLASIPAGHGVKVE